MVHFKHERLRRMVKYSYQGSKHETFAFILTFGNENAHAEPKGAPRGIVVSRHLSALSTGRRSADLLRS